MCTWRRGLYRRRKRDFGTSAPAALGDLVATQLGTVNSVMRVCQTDKAMLSCF